MLWTVVHPSTFTHSIEGFEARREGGKDGTALGALPRWKVNLTGCVSDNAPIFLFGLSTGNIKVYQVKFKVIHIVLLDMHHFFLSLHDKDKAPPPPIRT